MMYDVRGQMSDSSHKSPSLTGEGWGEALDFLTGAQAP